MVPVWVSIMKSVIVDEVRQVSLCHVFSTLPRFPNIFFVYRSVFLPLIRSNINRIIAIDVTRQLTPALLEMVVEWAKVVTRSASSDSTSEMTDEGRRAACRPIAVHGVEPMDVGVFDLVRPVMAAPAASAAAAAAEGLQMAEMAWEALVLVCARCANDVAVKQAQTQGQQPPPPQLSEPVVRALALLADIARTWPQCPRPVRQLDAVKGVSTYFECVTYMAVLEIVLSCPLPARRRAVLQHLPLLQRLVLFRADLFQGLSKAYFDLVQSLLLLVLEAYPPPDTESSSSSSSSSSSNTSKGNNDTNSGNGSNSSSSSSSSNNGNGNGNEEDGMNDGGNDAAGTKQVHAFYQSVHEHFTRCLDLQKPQPLLPAVLETLVRAHPSFVAQELPAVLEYLRTFGPAEGAAVLGQCDTMKWLQTQDGGRALHAVHEAMVVACVRVLARRVDALPAKEPLVTALRTLLDKQNRTEVLRAEILRAVHGWCVPGPSVVGRCVTVNDKLTLLTKLVPGETGRGTREDVAQQRLYSDALWHALSLVPGEQRRGHVQFYMFGLVSCDCERFLALLAAELPPTVVERVLYLLRAPTWENLSASGRMTVLALCLLPLLDLAAPTTLPPLHAITRPLLGGDYGCTGDVCGDVSLQQQQQQQQNHIVNFLRLHCPTSRMQF